MTSPAESAGLGYVNLLKPPGITSQGAVAMVRRLTGAPKAGHAGTLDPAAAGVLVISLGQATRLTSYISHAAKAYRAEVTFGIATDTLDAEGRVTGRASAAQLTAEQVRAALPHFHGRIAQVPPLYSALHRGGRRLYQLARAGENVAPPPRYVTIERLELLRFRPGAASRALLDLSCSPGTYVRSLAADLGAALGLPAYLSFLVRTRVGGFALAESLTPDELAARAHAGEIASAIVPLDAPLAGMRRIVLDPGQQAAVQQGQAVVLGATQMPAEGDTEPVASQEIAMYNQSGALLGIARSGESGTLRPRIVLTSGRSQ